MRQLIIVRGAGDLATGTIYELHKAGYPVLALESKRPAAIRREVCFSEAVYQGEKEVEGVVAKNIQSLEEMEQVFSQGKIPVLVDESGESISRLKPYVVIDLILAKKNLGTRMEMAPLVIGAGPGFVAGEDVHVVIETMRGYHPGKAIYEGSAVPNTGIPGMVGGYAKERVIHSKATGQICNICKIGDVVAKGQMIARVADTPVYATIDGILRGLIRDGYEVYQGMKIADIDPRLSEKENCYKRSDKSIAIGKGILKVIEERIKMQMLLNIDIKYHKVIAFVGAGGKTSCMFELAEELAREHKSVIVTTTTHIQKTENNIEGIQVVGMPSEEEGKLQSLPKEEYLQLKNKCDVLLVEADGARRKSLKVPDLHEPVIPPDADVVIGILGASAIGKKIKECAHRISLAAQVLEKNEEAKVTLDDLLFLLDSDKGQRKNVTVSYRKVIGQGNLLSEEQKERLRQEGVCIYTKNLL